MRDLTGRLAVVVLQVLLAASSLGCARTPPLDIGHATNVERIEKLQRKAAELDQRSPRKTVGQPANNGGKL